MKVAFDCKGTLLEGPEAVRTALDWFQSKGAEIIVWSCGWMHLNEARREFGDSFSYVTKEYDADRVDLAIDDDYMCKSWLPADQVVMVYDLPDTEDLLEEKFGHLFE